MLIDSNSVCEGFNKYFSSVYNKADRIKSNFVSKESFAKSGIKISVADLTTAFNSQNVTKNPGPDEVENFTILQKY